MSTQPNSMSPGWCAARLADARAFRDSRVSSTPGWHHVNELLNQLDHPPLPDLRALHKAASQHIQPNGQPYKWGASDKAWREYRKLATPQAILALLARCTTLAQQHQEAKQEADCLLFDKLQAEEEVDKLRQQLAVVEAGYSERGKQLFKALSVLAGMWNQYCPPPTEKCPYPGHMFMSAGEDTEELLEQWGLLRKDETAIDCDFANEFAEAPEEVKALLSGKKEPAAPPLAGEAAASPQIEPLPPTYPDSLFANQQEYDDMVADVVRRVKSGEIKPRELELAQLHRCDLCDDSPVGLCPEHAPTPSGAPLEGSSPASELGMLSMRPEHWQYVEGAEPPKVEAWQYLIPNRPGAPTAWNVYIGPKPKNWAGSPAKEKGGQQNG